MFTVIKRMEISASHKLVLPYRSKCASLHGHNWIITVYCRSARSTPKDGGRFHPHQRSGHGETRPSKSERSTPI